MGVCSLLNRISMTLKACCMTLKVCHMTLKVYHMITSKTCHMITLEAY